MRRRLGVFLAGCAVLLAACGGPKEPLEVGVREFPTEVLFGGTESRIVPPPSGLDPVPGFPVLVQPPSRSTSSSAAVPVAPILASCPKAHPFDAPRYVAGTRSRAAPIAASYPFRSEGTFERTQAGRKTTGTFPETIRIVRNVAKTANDFTYSIEENLGDRKVTTDYRVVPDSPLADQRGVFITRVVSGNASFDPANDIRLLPFPVEVGGEWDAIGTDPLSQTTMNFHAKVGLEIPDGGDADEAPDLLPKARVDACGTVLDGWYVQIKNGEVFGPSTDLTFNWVIVMGTQFGGFPLLEDIQETGTDRGVQSTGHRIATISKEPLFPGEG
jgi:hypothetical protein